MNKFKNAPKLSIIIPAYNASKTIDRCLSFIVNQSFDDYEVIVIDDCSEDNTTDIIIEYQNRYGDKIVVLRTEEHGGGPGLARNLGIDKATGKYISFVDADDWIDSSLYSVVLSYLEISDADVAVFGVKDEYLESSFSQIRYNYALHNIIDNKFALNMLSHLYNNDSYISPMACHKIYKSDFIKTNNLSFKVNSYFEDDWFTFSMLLHDCKIELIPNVFYHYYQNPNSITHTFSNKHIEGLFELIIDLKEYLNTTGMWDVYKKEYYSFCKKCIHSTMNMLFKSETNEYIQKTYIQHFIQLTQTQLNNNDLLDYVNFCDLKKFLTTL